MPLIGDARLCLSALNRGARGLPARGAIFRGSTSRSARSSRSSRRWRAPTTRRSSPSGWCSNCSKALDRGCDRGRRSRHAVSVFLRLLRREAAPAGATSPTARTARSATRSPRRMGAHVARPKVKTVAVMGDGSFGMCVGELETAVRLRLPITFVVISNAVYGWIKAGQKTGYERRYFSVDFGVTDHAKVAEAFGVKSWRVFDPAKLGAVLKKPRSSHDGPTLVDIVCQPLHEARAPVSEWVAMKSHHDMGGEPGSGRRARRSTTTPTGSGASTPWRCCSGGSRARRSCFTVDEHRRAIESLPPQAYDSMAYYEKWIVALAQCLVQRGVVTSAELARKMQDVDVLAPAPRHGRPPGRARSSRPSTTTPSGSAASTRCRVLLGSQKVLTVDERRRAIESLPPRGLRHDELLRALDRGARADTASSAASSPPKSWRARWPKSSRAIA